MKNKKKIYFGVYGIYKKGSSILLIKKARGPYVGKYDLPGGGLEPGENIGACLKREIKEETGGRIKKKIFLGINEYICTYKFEGKVKFSHHIGLYYSVDIEIKNLKTEPDGEDSNGALFIPIDKLNPKNVSPIAYPIIKKYIDGKKK